MKNENWTPIEPIAEDGTREYHPHARRAGAVGQNAAQNIYAPGIPLFPVGSPVPVAGGSLSAAERRARAAGATPPDLTFSGEWPRPTRHFTGKPAADSAAEDTGNFRAPEMPPEVVENQLRDREEFPYG